MKIDKDRLKELVVKILKSLRANEEETCLVAESLVRADMRGVETHGVQFLELLSKRVEASVLSVPTLLKVVRDEDTTALIDGGNGFGQVAAHRGMKMSIQKARRFGIGCSLIRNTNNIGMLAFYTLIAAEEGMIGIVMTNAAPSMPPWGGAEPFLGTNPISIAVPTDSEAPVVLDMASSVAARGKIHRAQEKGEPIPLGWAVDENGSPTTDPHAALKGMFLPIGGPKGYGLALMIDVLAGMLSGSNYGPKVKRFHHMLGPTGVGAFMMALDPERFMPLGQFKALMKSYRESIKGVKRAQGVSEIYLPGEIEFYKERQSLTEGVEIDSKVMENLKELLKKYSGSTNLR